MIQEGDRCCGQRTVNIITQTYTTNDQKSTQDPGEAIRHHSSENTAATMPNPVEANIDANVDALKSEGAALLPVCDGCEPPPVLVPRSRSTAGGGVYKIRLVRDIKTFERMQSSLGPNGGCVVLSFVSMYAFERGIF